MISRILACPFSDMPYAKATAEQWPCIDARWDRDRLTLTLDDSRLDAANERLTIDQVVETVDRSVRTHAFSRRGT